MNRDSAMSDDPRVEQLLEELLDSGGTPEEVCRACPELLAQVRAGWQRLRAVEAKIDGLFPPSSAVAGAGPAAPPTVDLPRIRGCERPGILRHVGMRHVYRDW